MEQQIGKNEEDHEQHSQAGLFCLPLLASHLLSSLALAVLLITHIPILRFVSTAYLVSSIATKAVKRDAACFILFTGPTNRPNKTRNQSSWNSIYPTRSSTRSPRAQTLTPSLNYAKHRLDSETSEFHRRRERTSKSWTTARLFGHWF